MPVAQDLSAVLDFSERPLSRLEVFADHIPDEWIATAASLADKATIRRRRLPSDMVLWLVVGMALFRGEPVIEVARRLNICADGLANEVLLAKSGLSQARQRLGKQPVEWLFQQCANVWGYERYPQDDWHGLKSLPLMAPYFERRKHPTCERILAQEIPPPIVKRLIQCYVL